jgi:pseudaminic acid synthase
MALSHKRITFQDLWTPRSEHQSPLIVAELSGSHNQSLSRALKLIEIAAECGCDAVKLQTYTADKITLDAPHDDFRVRKPGSVWDGRSLYSLYEEAHTPWEWHRPMIDKATSLGLAWFSSPFDFTAVDFLETMNVPCYKIASPELIDLPLIKKCAQTGKPLVMSTGMAKVEEIAEAVQTARQNGCLRMVLLKCTSDYPASPEASNLRTMAHMAELFGCPTGVSDHTLGLGAATAAAALGAVMIEKHLTLSRDDGGPDSHFSLEPPEMKALVNECRSACDAVGKVTYGPTNGELGLMRGRRSLYVVGDMKAGDALTPENLRSIRPGFGLPPKYYEMLLGKRISCDAPKGTALTWKMVGL